MKKNIKRLTVNMPIESINRLKNNAIDLTDEKETFTVSKIMGTCINALLQEDIEKKEKRKTIKYELRINKDTILKLRYKALETGYTLSELVNMAYEKYNPDVSEIW